MELLDLEKPASDACAEPRLGQVAEQAAAITMLRREAVEQSREANLVGKSTSFISAWVRDASRTSFPRDKEADVTSRSRVK